MTRSRLRLMSVLAEDTNPITRDLDEAFNTSFSSHARTTRVHLRFHCSERDDVVSSGQACTWIDLLSMAGQVAGFVLLESTRRVVTRENARVHQLVLRQCSTMQEALWAMLAVRFFNCGSTTST